MGAITKIIMKITKNETKPYAQGTIIIDIDKFFKYDNTKGIIAIFELSPKTLNQKSHAHKTVVMHSFMCSY
jgi:hypothetical protein